MIYFILTLSSILTSGALGMMMEGVFIGIFGSIVVNKG